MFNNQLLFIHLINGYIQLDKTVLKYFCMQINKVPHNKSIHNNYIHIFLTSSFTFDMLSSEKSELSESFCDESEVSLSDVDEESLCLRTGAVKHDTMESKEISLPALSILNV